MINPWSYAETPIIEDAFTLFYVHLRSNQKSFGAMYKDFLQYIEIMDDTLSQPIIDTFLCREIEWEDNYIGTIR